MADQHAVDAQRVIESYMAMILEFTNDPDDPDISRLDFANMCNLLRPERIREFRDYKNTMLSRPDNNFNVRVQPPGMADGHRVQRTGMADGDPSRRAYVESLFQSLEFIIERNPALVPPAIVLPF